MMISLDRARDLAREIVAALGAASDDDFALMDDKTLSVDGGWLFFYNTREFIETGDFVAALVGNGPIYVDGLGNARALSSAMTWEDAIRSS